MGLIPVGENSEEAERFMADYAELTLGSLAYDPFGTAAPQIDFPPEREREIPRNPTPEEQPSREAQPRQRVRLGTAEEAAARAAERRRGRLIAAFMTPLAAACLVLLVLLLQAHTRLTAVSGEAAHLEARIASLQAEHARLEIRCESAFNMEEVELTARTTIGMIKADTDQAIYLRSTTEDLAVVLDPNRKPASVLKRLERLWDRVAEYLGAPGA